MSTREEPLKKLQDQFAELLKHRGPVEKDAAALRAEEELLERARQRGRDCDAWIVIHLRQYYEQFQPSLNLTPGQLESLVNDGSAVDLALKFWQGLDRNPQIWEKAKIPRLSQGSELPKDFWSKIIPPEGSNLERAKKYCYGHWLDNRIEAQAVPGRGGASFKFNSPRVHARLVLGLALYWWNESDVQNSEPDPPSQPEVANQKTTQQAKPLNQEQQAEGKGLIPTAPGGVAPTSNQEAVSTDGSTKEQGRQLTQGQIYCALNFGVIPSTASISAAKREIQDCLCEDGARAEACAMERLEERLQRTTGKDGRPDASGYFDETFRRTLEYERKRYPFDHLSARNSFVLFESAIEHELTYYPDHFAPIYGSTADMLDPGSRPEWLTFEIMWKFQEKLLGALREWLKRAPNPVIGAAINKITAARQKFRFIEQEAQPGNAKTVAIATPGEDETMPDAATIDDNYRETESGDLVDDAERHQAEKSIPVWTPDLEEKILKSATDPNKTWGDLTILAGFIYSRQTRDCVRQKVYTLAKKRGITLPKRAGRGNHSSITPKKCD